eukprot:scaffold84066_cov27-Attheya_sp.AAC.1
MATAPASTSGTLLQEATSCTSRDTPSIAEATDDPAPSRKRLRRSNRQEEANGECEHDKNAAAPAAQHLFFVRNSTTFAESSICTPFWP